MSVFVPFFVIKLRVSVFMQTFKKSLQKECRILFMCVIDKYAILTILILEFVF